MAVTRFKEPVCDRKYHATFLFVTNIGQFFVVLCHLSHFTRLFIIFIITTLLICNGHGCDVVQLPLHEICHCCDCLVSDVDECAIGGTNNCEQICNNHVGSFNCSCHSGYELHNDTECVEQGKF